MRVILPFVYPTIVDTYSGVAGNVAVQMTDESYIPLVIYNHFLVTYYNTGKFCGFNWEYYNDNYGVFNNMNSLIESDNIVTSFIEIINRRLYIHTYMDHFYIKGTQHYQKKHFLHDSATVFGYDDDQRIFYVADNFVYGKYSVWEIPYEDVEQAVINNNKNNIDSFYYYNDIDFRLNIENILLIVKGYLDGCCYYSSINNKPPKNSNEVTYGINIYAILREECMMAVKSKYSDVDYRTFHIMCNHMSVGSLLIEFLNENILANKVKKIDNNYCKMKEKMIFIRTLFIKACISKNTKVMEEVQEKINQLQGEEKKYLEEIVKILKDEMKKC